MIKDFVGRCTLAVTAALVPAVALADDPTGIVTGGVCNAQTGFTNCNKSLFGSGSVVSNIVHTLIFLVGAISVIMIIVGGLRMALSSGNPANIKSARETIVYAIVGVIVAVFSYAIVTFALGLT